MSRQSVEGELNIRKILSITYTVSLITTGVMLGLYDRVRKGMEQTIRRWSGRGKITR